MGKFPGGPELVLSDPITSRNTDETIHSLTVHDAFYTIHNDIFFPLDFVFSKDSQKFLSRVTLCPKSVKTEKQMERYD
jgi:hypothetical protein